MHSVGTNVGCVSKHRKCLRVMARPIKQITNLVDEHKQVGLLRT